VRASPGENAPSGFLIPLEHFFSAQRHRLVQPVIKSIKRFLFRTVYQLSLVTAIYHLAPADARREGLGDSVFSGVRELGGALREGEGAAELRCCVFHGDRSHPPGLSDAFVLLLMAGAKIALSDARRSCNARPYPGSRQRTKRR
jgi:hypothetical protein